LDEGVTTTSFHVSVQGSFESTINYLELLSELDVFHQLASCRLVPRETESQGQVTMDLQIDFVRFDTDLDQADDDRGGEK
jgi:hypothetical protein